MTPSNKIPKKKLDTYKTFLTIHNPPRHGILTGIIEHRTLLGEIIGSIIKPLRR